MRRYIGQILFYIFLLNLCTYSQTPTWEFLGLDDKIITNILISDSNHIFVAVEPGAVYKSTDNGNTWIQKNNGITATTGMALDIDSQGSIYLAALGGVFKSVNGGENWFRIAQNLSDLEFIETKVIPNDYVFVSNFDGIHRSTDYGQTWITTNYTFFGAEEVGINANGVMFAGNLTASNFSIYRSTNFGENWNFSSSFPSTAFLFPINGDVLAGVGKTDFNPRDIYKSTDNGLNWIRTYAFPNTFFITYRDLELDRNGDFYLAMSGSPLFSGVHISTDAGVSWSNYGFSLPTKCLAIDSSGYVWAGTNRQGIYRTAGTTVPVFDIIDNSSNDFNLYQNYPNPFNTTTKIKFDLAELEFVTLNVFDVLGNKVGVLINDEKPAGSYEVIFDTFELPSGIYFYKLQVGSYSQEKKMIHLK